MIYFKTHKNNLEDFIQAKSRQFEFTKKDGKIARMCYYMLPEEILEDREELQKWIDKALDY
jgi:TfoX/Sxy family transcriptional regulator of competence genes